jgi:hypothetical protein
MYGGYKMSKQQIDLLKKHYKVGSEVELIRLNDETSDLKKKKGDRGIIQSVDDTGQIHVDWYNGSSLALVYQLDEFIVIS